MSGTETAKRNGKAIMEYVKTWVPIIVTVAAILMAVGVWGDRLEAVEVKVSVQEIKVEELGDMRVQLAEMQRDIEWIRERLDRESLP